MRACVANTTGVADNRSGVFGKMVHTFDGPLRVVTEDGVTEDGVTAYAGRIVTAGVWGRSGVFGGIADVAVAVAAAASAWAANCM